MRTSFMPRGHGAKTRFVLCLTLLSCGLLPAKAQLIDPNNRCVYQPGSRTCEPTRAPTAPQTSGPPYEQFEAIVRNGGISLDDHPTYTSTYYGDRAQLYCSLLSQGEMNKILKEVTFPPVVHMTETPRNRSRLEVVILRVGTANACPSFWAQEQQFEATYVR